MPFNIASMESSLQDKSDSLDLSSRDLTRTKLWGEISQFYKSLHGPGYDKISHAVDIQYSSQRKTISFTGFYWPKPKEGQNELRGTPTSRICLLKLKDPNSLRTITHGPNNDKAARWSPNGKDLLFLSDRLKSGVFQPYILAADQFGEAEPLVNVENGSVEYAEWSPNGDEILLGVAGLGADNAAAGQGQGSGKVTSNSEADNDSWMPSVEAKFKENQWRRLMIFDLSKKNLRQISPKNSNPWEASWAGPDKIVSVSSSGPGEEDWYHSDIEIVDIHQDSGKSFTVHKANYEGKVRQLGSPTGSSSGEIIAFIRSLASDRTVIAGDVYVSGTLDGSASQVFKLPVPNVDVTFAQLLKDNNESSVNGSEAGTDETLLYAGLSGTEIVVGTVEFRLQQDSVDVIQNKEIFRSSEGISEPYYPKASFLYDSDSALVALQSRSRPTEIGIVTDGTFVKLHSLSHPGFDWLRTKVGESSRVSWQSSDGQKIHGLLDLPSDKFTKPYPLILHVHGGPTAAWLNTWTAWNAVQLLVTRGYAVLWTNPRGSTGWGQAFAEKVLGDVGGMETKDHLSGIDHLIKQGIADPERIGVIGGSHGGFMASWIITQDSRFKASVPIAAVTDWHAQHFTTNIRNFDPLYTQDDPYHMKKDSLYYTRSPIMLANKIKTPVLQIAGDKDLCVDFSQGKEFHNALLEHNVDSVLAVYPGEGHGIRKFPAVIDFNVRTVGWFEKYMPSDKGRE